MIGWKKYQHIIICSLQNQGEFLFYIIGKLSPYHPRTHQIEGVRRSHLVCALTLSLSLRSDRISLEVMRTPGKDEISLNNLKHSNSTDRQLNFKHSVLRTKILYIFFEGIPNYHIAGGP
jgi:hypothetical protein